MIPVVGVKVVVRWKIQAGQSKSRPDALTVV